MPPPLRSSSSSTTSAAAPPTGRVELLSWINAVCGSRYPCIESLRDGVAYLSLVEAALSRGASLSKSNNNSNEVGDGVLSGASQLLNKADIDVTALVVASSSSSSSSTSAGATVSDSIQVRERCERNFHLLQEMLRKYVPRDGSVEVDVKRLASGKLQDHLRLLQWCVKFVSRQLTPKPVVASSSSSATPNKTRSRSAGVTNHRDPQHAPQDDADRNNSKSSGRTFQRNASTPAAATAAQPKKGGDVATAQARGFGSRGQQQQQQAARSQSAHGVSSSSSSSPGGVGSASTAVGEVQYDPLRYKSNTTPSSKPPPPGTSNTSALGEGAVVDTELEKLLNEVESLEREAWAAGGPQTGDDGNGDVTSFSSPLTKNSLSTVRELLHERDVLWQTLVAIEATVWTAAQRQQHQRQYSFEEEGPSPQRPSSQLLKDLCAVFNVDLPE